METTKLYLLHRKWQWSALGSDTSAIMEVTTKWAKSSQDRGRLKRVAIMLQSIDKQINSKLSSRKKHKFLQIFRSAAPETSGQLRKRVDFCSTSLTATCFVLYISTSWQVLIWTFCFLNVPSPNLTPLSVRGQGASFLVTFWFWWLTAKWQCCQVNEF